MSQSVLSPEQALQETATHLAGTLCFGAGSGLVAINSGLAWSDLDIFVPTQEILISTITRLLDSGYTIPDRYDRVWHRWLRYGMRGWHTNSMKLHSRNDVEVNIVFKIVDGHATTSLAQVLESFDFGLLGVGYDFETMQFKDMRSYLFPHLNPDGPLPLMPNKRDAWRNGFISRYNGLREASRYVKYYGYGYDLSAVKEDLSLGYRMVALYHSQSHDTDKQLLGQIYTSLADQIEHDEIDELAEAYKLIDYNDPLEEILNALD
jgi:hypothetical protein